MSKALSTMTALIYSPVLHNRRCTIGVKIGDLMRDLGEKVKLGRIAHQEYYIIIDRLSQAELAKSVSHNDFTRKPGKGGCDGLGKLKFSDGGYNCMVNGTHGINPKWRRAHGKSFYLSTSRPLSLSRSGATSRFTYQSKGRVR